MLFVVFGASHTHTHTLRPSIECVSAAKKRETDREKKNQQNANRHQNHGISLFDSPISKIMLVDVVVVVVAFLHQYFI